MLIPLLYVELEVPLNKRALLVLEDGSVFRGHSIGVDGKTVGEVVFNTALTGYQEILTDPSYAQQIVTLTYPHIGNTGVNSEDTESGRIHAAGLVVRDVPPLYSSWRGKQSLGDYLQQHRMVAIADIDTRRLTRILREKGAQRACIMAGDSLSEADAKAAALDFPGLKGMDLAKKVSVTEPYVWTEGTWHLLAGVPQAATAKQAEFKVVAYDYGVKTNILRMLVDRACHVTVVPAQTPVADVLAMNPDGIFLSNGPGDPEPCTYAIEAIQVFIEKKIPLLGICLGHQLLGLATGARTLKMKFGHHGANHPVQDIASGRVMISSQNHGFAVDESTLPANVRSSHRSLFDGTLQGIELNDCPAFSFQGHPEASPGPHDVAPVFDHFIELMRSARSA